MGQGQPGRKVGPGCDQLLQIVHAWALALDGGQPAPIRLEHDVQLGLGQPDLFQGQELAHRHARQGVGKPGLVVGDQQPYSGKLLNATMNRHAEARGLPYLGIEVRQDRIDTPEAQERWGDLIAEVAARVALMLEAA